jgi:hypothetical protein
MSADGVLSAKINSPTPGLKARDWTSITYDSGDFDAALARLQIEDFRRWQTEAVLKGATSGVDQLRRRHWSRAVRRRNRESASSTAATQNEDPWRRTIATPAQPGLLQSIIAAGAAFGIEVILGLQT